MRRTYVTQTWAPAAPRRTPDNIVSSDYTTTRTFVPSYEKETQPRIEQLLSNDYQRIWWQEKKAWDIIIEDKKSRSKRILPRMLVKRKVPTCVTVKFPTRAERLKGRKKGEFKQMSDPKSEERAKYSEISEKHEMKFKKHEETQSEAHEETKLETHEKIKSKNYKEGKLEERDETKLEKSEENNIKEREETKLEENEEKKSEDHEETQLEKNEKTKSEKHEETQLEKNEETKSEKSEEIKSEKGEKTQSIKDEETQLENNEDTKSEKFEETKLENNK